MTSRPACVVSDTSPLSAMAKMGWLGWLADRWTKVMVPDVVWRELSDIGDDAAWSSLEAARGEGWLQIVETPQGAAPQECAKLHSGETGAIQLALACKADWLLVDDGDARRVTKALGLRIIGLLGMVVWAKREGKICSALDAIAELRRITRFRVSDEVVSAIAEDLGE